MGCVLVCLVLVDAAAVQQDQETAARDEHANHHDHESPPYIPRADGSEDQNQADNDDGADQQVAIPEGGSRQDMIIDPPSGLVIGEQIVTLKEYPGVPSGTIESWTSIQSSVVDSTP